MYSRLITFSVALFLSPAPIWAQTPQIAEIEADLEANFDFRCTLQPSSTKPKATGHSPASLLLGYKKGAAPLTLNFSAEELNLTTQKQGKAVVLDSIKPALPPHDSKGIPVVVQWRNGDLRVIFDGRTLLRRQGLGTLSVGTALSSKSGDYEIASPQYQPVEPVSFSDDFMRGAGDAGQWEAISGEWKIRSAADPAKVANAFTYAGHGQPAIAVAGRWFWDDYRISAAVRPKAQSTIGLIAYWQDAKNYLVFRWLPEDDTASRGRQKQLWRVWRGQMTLIAAAPGGYRADQWYHLSLGAGSGVVTANIDGQQVLQKRTDLFGQGKAGLFCSGEQAALVDDVTIEDSATATPHTAVYCEAITPQFTKEQSMENWASPKAQWLPVTTAAGTISWHRGTFFDDHALELKATAVEANRASLAAILGADGKAPDSGYTLIVKAKDKDQFQASLLRAGKIVSQPRDVKIGADAGLSLKLTREGKTVRAFIGTELVASFVDASALNGRRAGYAVQGAQIAASDAVVSGGNIYDYTFYRAPTDWYVNGGTWDMTNRWDCTPTWSWYGGWSERIAAIWNKHSFSGDFAVDLFAACKRDIGGYNHPRDINISIGGDGRDLASGYSFIFGGWNNTATRLMRGTQQVAETTKFLLPKDYQGQAHHKWFNLRVEKTGSLLSLYVDRELALQWKDPDPLMGRRMALWTCGNGVMIARATVYYQKELAAEPVPMLVDNHDWNLPSVDKLGWIARGKDTTLRLEAVSAPVAAKVLASAKTPEPIPAVRALNLEGGGPFAIAPELEPFDVLKMPRLSFDCRLEKGAAVNLYLRAKGVMHSIRLSGPAKEMEMETTKVLGSALNLRADDQWHTVSLDLATLFKPLYPSDTEIRVEELFLGNLSRDIYHQAGFGANPPGASYFVRSFALRGADNRIARTIEPLLKSASATPKIASQPLMAAIPVVATVEAAPGAPARGLLNLRVTYCQDADGGEFKPETLNQPIPWECFSRPLVTTKVESIDFNWADKAPNPGIRPKYWSARFFGKLLVPKQGDYTFVMDRLDDGGRLYIDGKPVIDSWRIQAAASQESKPVTLSPGLHDIRLDYSQGNGMGSLTLRWNGPDFAREVLSTTQLKK